MFGGGSNPGGQQKKPSKKAKLQFTPEMDEILKRISDIKYVAGVVVVNSEGITVKSTLDNVLSVQVRHDPGINFFQALMNHESYRADRHRNYLEPTFHTRPFKTCKSFFCLFWFNGIHTSTRCSCPSSLRGPSRS